MTSSAPYSGDGFIELGEEVGSYDEVSYTTSVVHLAAGSVARPDGSRHLIMDAQVVRNDGQGGVPMGKTCGIDPCGCPPGNAATGDDGGERVEPEVTALHGFPTEWAMCEPVAPSPTIH